MFAVVVFINEDGANEDVSYTLRGRSRYPHIYVHFRPSLCAFIGWRVSHASL